MIRIFKTEDGVMHEKTDLQPGCWIALTNPTASEVMDVADACQIDPDHIKCPGVTERCGSRNRTVTRSPQGVSSAGTGEA